MLVRATLSTMGRSASVLRQLIDMELRSREPGSLATLVTRSRAAGASWRAIAQEVHDLTGQNVSDVTLCRWFSA